MVWLLTGCMALALVASVLVRQSERPTRVLLMNAVFWILMATALFAGVGGDNDALAWVIRCLGLIPAGLGCFWFYGWLCLRGASPEKAHREAWSGVNESEEAPP